MSNEADDKKLEEAGKCSRHDLLNLVSDLLVERRQLYDQLTHVQGRCTAKENQIRDLKRELGKKKDDD